MRVAWEAEDMEPGRLVTDAAGEQVFMIGAYTAEAEVRVYCLVGYYSGAIHRIGTREKLAEKMTKCGMKPT